MRAWRRGVRPVVRASARAGLGAWADSPPAARACPLSECPTGQADGREQSIFDHLAGDRAVESPVLSPVQQINKTKENKNNDREQGLPKFPEISDGPAAERTDRATEL